MNAALKGLSRAFLLIWPNKSDARKEFTAWTYLRPLLTSTTKDTGCNHHLPLSIWKLNRRDAYFTQQKYPYRCMDFLPPVLGFQNQSVLPKTGDTENQFTTTFNIEIEIYCTADKSRFSYFIYHDKTKDYQYT